MGDGQFDDDFFEHHSNSDSNSDEDLGLMEVEGENDFEIPPESKISRTLTDRTVKTVIVMVLLLLFMLPTLSRSNWDN